MSFGYFMKYDFTYSFVLSIFISASLSKFMSAIDTLLIGLDLLIRLKKGLYRGLSNVFAGVYYLN